MIPSPILLFLFPYFYIFQDVWILAATLGLVKFVHEEMKAYRWLRKKRRKIPLSLSLSPSLTNSLSCNLSPSLSPSLSISLFFPFNLLPSPSISLSLAVSIPLHSSHSLSLSHTQAIYCCSSPCRIHWGIDQLVSSSIQIPFCPFLCIINLRRYNCRN